MRGKYNSSKSFECMYLIDERMYASLFERRGGDSRAADSPHSQNTFRRRPPDFGYPPDPNLPQNDTNVRSEVETTKLDNFGGDIVPQVNIPPFKESFKYPSDFYENRMQAITEGDENDNESDNGDDSFEDALDSVDPMETEGLETEAPRFQAIKESKALLPQSIREISEIPSARILEEGTSSPLIEFPPEQEASHKPVKGGKRAIEWKNKRKKIGWKGSSEKAIESAKLSAEDAKIQKKVLMKKIRLKRKNKEAKMNESSLERYPSEEELEKEREKLGDIWKRIKEGDSSNKYEEKRQRLERANRSIKESSENIKMLKKGLEELKRKSEEEQKKRRELNKISSRNTIENMEVDNFEDKMVQGMSVKKYVKKVMPKTAIEYMDEGSDARVGENISTENSVSEAEVEKEARKLHARWKRALKSGKGDLGKYVVQKEALNNIKKNITDSSENIRVMKDKINELRKSKKRNTALDISRRLGKRKEGGEWEENLKRARTENNLDKKISIRTSRSLGKVHKKKRGRRKGGRKNNGGLVLLETGDRSGAKIEEENVPKIPKSIYNNYEFIPPFDIPISIKIKKKNPPKPPLKIGYTAPLAIEYKRRGKKRKLPPTPSWGGLLRKEEEISKRRRIKKSGKEKKSKKKSIQHVYENLINDEGMETRKAPKRKSKEISGRLREKYRKRGDGSSADE